MRRGPQANDLRTQIRGPVVPIARYVVQGGDDRQSSPSRCDGLWMEPAGAPKVAECLGENKLQGAE
jgi:hypothetical protein